MSGWTTGITSRLIRNFCGLAEVHHLRGNYAKARQKLGWEPRVTFEKLIEMMVDSDLALLAKDSSQPASFGVR